ncbi:putative peptidase precursor [Corynebacterium faecale]|nr:putative peptidase precursor [Corynebacterium faecale]
MPVITSLLRSILTMVLVTAVVITGSTLPAAAVTGGYHVSGDVRGGSLVRLHIGEMACTGALITPEWVLTARHCIGEGPHRYASVGSRVVGQERAIVDWRRHPSADLAVVRLSSPVAAATANLSGWHQHPGTYGTVAGWGGATSRHMPIGLQADATIQRRIINLPSPDRGAVLLEATIYNGRLLPGDSGGALWVNGEIAGVLSMSTATNVASQDGTMGWFVPVSEYLGWIAQNTGKAVPGTVGDPSPLKDATAEPSRIPAAHTHPSPVPGSTMLEDALGAWGNWNTWAAGSY